MKKAQEPNTGKIQKNSHTRIIRWNGPASLTQEEAEARLRKEGYESFCWYDVPGTSYPKHRHSCDECLWILNGEIRFTLPEGEEILRAGDRIYLPAKVPHTAEVPKTQGVTYLVGQKT